jgi:hypothetical protein
LHFFCRKSAGLQLSNLLILVERSFLRKDNPFSAMIRISQIAILADTGVGAAGDDPDRDHRKKNRPGTHLVSITP